MVGAENYSFLVGVGSRGLVMHLLDGTPAFFYYVPVVEFKAAMLLYVILYIQLGFP